MDLEPAVEALSLVHDSDASRRLDLICLDIPDLGDDDQVESKKRKIKRLRRKQRAASSPLSPDSHKVGSLPEELGVVQTHQLSVSEDSNPHLLPPDVYDEGVEEIDVPSIRFTDFAWPEAAIQQPDESATHSRQTSVTTDQSFSKDSDCDFTRSVGLGNNARLRAMMDLFPDDQMEQFEHTFLCFKGNLFGVHHRPPLVYVLITNRGLYLLNHVHDSRLFSLHLRIEFQDLRHSIVDINGQGLKFVTKEMREAEVCCASQKFTEKVLRAISEVCHASGAPDPEVLADDCSKEIAIAKSLANFHKVQVCEMQIKYYGTVFCGRSFDENVNCVLGQDASEIMDGFDEGSFGLKEGILMYRLVDEENGKESEWEPGYFVLADGHLYCYSDGVKAKMKFFGQLFNNHCKGCRRLTGDDSRPNMIELKIVIDNMVQVLHIATSNELETTEWMINLLTSVNMEVSEDIGHFDGRNCLEKFCFVVMTDDAVYTLVRDVATGLYNVLDHVSMCDILSAVCSEATSESSFCYLGIEFEPTRPSEARELTMFFVTCQERDRMHKVLAEAWGQLFQVDLQTEFLAESQSSSVMCDTLDRLTSWHRNAVLAMSL